jgi:subtilisin-like proprotein convertase family protein
MKSILQKLLILSSFIGPLHAATISYQFPINQDIPDGSALGLSDWRSITAPEGEIVAVSVSLHFAGGYTGDLYAQLTYGSGFVVLLNRPGRTASLATGYLDTFGMDVTFADTTGLPDIHNYRGVISGSEGNSINVPIAGIWSPDGRVADPSQVTTHSPRTALLNSFHGLDPNGTWTFFAADLDGGGSTTLISWGLTLETIPEPSNSCLLGASITLPVLLRRRERNFTRTATNCGHSR